MRLLLVLTAVAVPAVFSQQCQEIDGIRPESWLIERARLASAGGGLPFPSHLNTTRVFTGAVHRHCSSGNPQHVLDKLCLHINGPSAQCVDTEICSPSEQQHFKFPFWSEYLKLIKSEKANPGAFGGELRSRTKACLTCYALAKPANPVTLTAGRDPTKKSVTLSTRLACGQPLSNPKAGIPAYFGPSEEDAAKLGEYDGRVAALFACQAGQFRGPGCNQQSFQRDIVQALQNRALYLDNFVMKKAAAAGEQPDPVQGHKKTLFEVPHDSAHVLQTEVDLARVPGGLLTRLPLPAGSEYPDVGNLKANGQSFCSAFEYGMVVVSPGNVATACWLSPMFQNPAARDAYVINEYNEELALQHNARKQAADKCGQNLQRKNQGQQLQPPELIGCIQFCLVQQAQAGSPSASPQLAQFMRVRFPTLCTQGYLPLRAQFAQQG